MKLSDWARANGVNPRYARRLFNEGKIPGARQISERIVLVDEPESTTSGSTVIYARVSSSDQKDSLDSQVGRILTWASSNGHTVSQVVKEVGSGLNDGRKKWNKILSDPSIDTIIVEHRDRASRFGFDQLNSALSASGRTILVVDESEVEDDLVRDMVEILTSFCARLYGRRGASAKAKKAMEVIDGEQ